MKCYGREPRSAILGNEDRIGGCVAMATKSKLSKRNLSNEFKSGSPLPADLRGADSSMTNRRLRELHAGIRKGENRKRSVF